MIKVVYFSHPFLTRMLVRYDDHVCLVRHHTDRIDFSPDIGVVCGRWSQSTLSPLGGSRLFIDNSMLREYGNFLCYKNGYLQESEVETEYKGKRSSLEDDQKKGKEILDGFYRVKEKSECRERSVIACLQIPLDGNLSQIKTDHVQYMYSILLSDILKIVPPGLGVIIRENPKMEFANKDRWQRIASRVNGFREGIRKLARRSRRNIAFDENKNILDTIRQHNIACGFTLNSSSAIHLLANGIPVVTDIYSIYGECLGLVKKEELLKKEYGFDQLVGRAVDAKELERFVGFYARNYQIARGVNIMDFKELMQDEVFGSKLNNIYIPASNTAERIELSIVIPTYNRPKVLKECLTALSRQDFPLERIEVIVVDDCSDKRTEGLETVNGLKIKYLRQDRNKGPSAARNRGLKESQARIVAFLDDDCTPAKDWAGKIIEYHRKYPEEGAIQGAMNPLQKNLFGLVWKINFDSIVEKGFITGNRKYVNILGGNVSFKRNVFYGIGGYNEALRTGEDLDLLFRLQDAGINILFASDILADHCCQRDIFSFAKKHFLRGKNGYHFLKLWGHRERGRNNSVKALLGFRKMREIHGFQGSLRIILVQNIKRISRITGHLCEFFLDYL